MNPYITTLTAEQLTQTVGMSTKEYTTFVNSKVNETDLIAEDCGTHVNLYVLPY